MTNISEKHWKVVVFDEFQALQPTEQAKLLKPLEQLNNVFIIFATTDKKKVLSSICSRALELHFSTVSYNAILMHLGLVAEEGGINVSQEAMQYIAHRSHGHMRTVHMLLDKYTIMGEEAFMRNITTTVDCLCNFFISAIEQKPDSLKYLNMLVNRSLAELREDFDEFIEKCAQETIGIPSNNNNIARVAKVYGTKFDIIVNTYFQEWVTSMFKSDKLFSLSMMNFYKAINDI
jgi:DNA polymerase III gamma/tau subunit